MKTHDVLSQIAWGEKHFGSIVTGRALPRRDVMREVAAGNVESVGLAAICDGDGFTIQPERYREGFRFTAAGRKIFEDEEARREAEFKAAWEGKR